MEAKGNICLFCLTLATYEDSVRIEDITYIIQRCFPELDSVVSSGSVCLSCLEGLEDYFNFVGAVLKAEEKINEYVDNAGATQVVLLDVVRHMMKIECDEDHHKNDESAIKEDPEEQFAVGPESYEIEHHITMTETMPQNGLVPYKTSKQVIMWKCKLCKFETKYKNNFKYHLLIHKNPKIHKCELCGHKAKTKGALKSHSLIHKKPEEVEMYKCASCSYETKRKDQLKMHWLIHKSREEVEMYKCESCGYEAKRKGQLKRHSLVHKKPEEVEMHKCELCSYETRRKGSLKNHSLVHKKPEEVEMYKCKLCSFEAKRKGNLKVHSLIHETREELEMLKCESCSYQTKWKGQLKNHMLIHKNPNNRQVQHL